MLRHRSYRLCCRVGTAACLVPSILPPCVALLVPHLVLGRPLGRLCRVMALSLWLLLSRHPPGLCGAVLLATCGVQSGFSLGHAIFSAACVALSTLPTSLRRLFGLVCSVVHLAACFSQTILPPVVRLPSRFCRALRLNTCRLPYARAPVLKRRLDASIPRLGLPLVLRCQSFRLFSDVRSVVCVSTTSLLLCILWPNAPEIAHPLLGF